MLKVRFYDEADDALIKFAVIIARHHGQWVLCKHRDRDTLEVPGGHREKGESVLDAAERELKEETGALEFSLRPVCVYSVAADKEDQTFGKLYVADIVSFEDELHSEIEQVIISEELPLNWTYPLIQPKLIEKAKELGFV